MKTDIDSRYIWRDPYDLDIFHITYTFERGNRTIFRTAITIHIDDIEGIFGLELYDECTNLKQGQRLDVFIDASSS